jgi:hypothetical protein
MRPHAHAVHARAPAGHQRPEDIKRLLEEAKGHRMGHLPGLPGAPGGAGLDDGCDSGMIEDAIQVRGRSCRPLLAGCAARVLCVACVCDLYQLPALHAGAAGVQAAQTRARLHVLDACG